MLKKKLTNLAKNDLIELKKRDELINERVLIVQALDLQKRIWLNDKLQKLGLDLTKQYSIDLNNGAITLKDEPTKDKGNS